MFAELLNKLYVRVHENKYTCIFFYEAARIGTEYSLKYYRAASSIQNNKSR